MTKYIKLDEVLALLPEADVVGPKPSHLRKLILNLDPILIEDFDEEEDIK